MKSRVPIRWRLTLWYAGLLALTLIVFGGVLYVGYRRALYGDLDETLSTEATAVLAAVQTTGGQPTLDLATIQPLSDEYLLRLVTPDGHTIAERSPVVGEVPLDQWQLAAALAGHRVYSSRPVNGQTLRILTVPVTTGERVVGALQIGLYRDDASDALRALLTLLAICAPLALAAAIGGGYLLAGRALAPVAAITGLAASIGGSGDDLSARLDLDLPDDELGQLARTFNDMLARIERAFERQRQFTADAAHELRTPLSLMRSEIDLALARPREPQEYRAALDDLGVDVERVTHLVGTLLMLARADRGQLALTRGPLDLAETIAVVAEQFTESASEQGVQLVSESQPAQMNGDEDLLVQVLVNLLDNALKHTPAGGTITLGCRADGGQVRLWVADTGSGISPEHLPHVFERFYRADGGRARASGGVGLGLNICRSIVEAHGGTIVLASEPGRGTRVDISLPAES